MPATKSVADVIKDHLVTNWTLGTVPKFEVTYETLQVHEPTKNTVRVAGAKGWRAPAGKGKENEYNRVKIYIHSPTDGLAEDFAAHVRGICTSPMPAGVDFAYFRDVDDTSERAGKVGLFGRYQYTLELMLESHSLPAGSASPITGASVGYWGSWSLVTINTEAALAGSTRLLTALGAFGFDMVPDSNNARDFGSSSRRIKKIWGVDLDISGSITGIDDADIPDTITLANLTQITTRNHSDLQNVLVDQHHTEIHQLVSAGGKHTASGLTTGHVLTAIGATSFAFQAPVGGLTGSGTSGVMAKWTGASALGDAGIKETQLIQMLAWSDSVMIPCQVIGSHTTAHQAYTPAYYDLKNAGTGSQYMLFEMPGIYLGISPLALGIDQLLVMANGLNGSNYITAVYIYTIDGYATINTAFSDLTDKTASGNLTWNPSFSCENAKRVVVRLDFTQGTASTIQILGVMLRGAYSDLS